MTRKRTEETESKTLVQGFAFPGHISRFTVLSMQWKCLNSGSKKKTVIKAVPWHLKYMYPLLISSVTKDLNKLYLHNHENIFTPNT